MSLAFHRGVTQSLRRRLQTAGIRIEEQDAQRALAGTAVVKAGSPTEDTVRDIAAAVWVERFTLMPKWENDHPGESPFPPVFAQVVLLTLQQAIVEDNLSEAVTEVIKLAEAELEL